ncbi:hypothetical protein [Paracoccus pantotrophus]|uniref:hypothetical protein n=1 Tax=Paracoccus pantotrophus TaxID=82367 RepID=UPI0035B11841
MKRRDLMRLAPAALVAGAAPPAGAAGVEETPVMRAFREWKAASDDLKDPKWDLMSVEEQDRACGRVSKMQDAILNIPAQDQRDFILKVMACTYFGEHGLPDHGERPDFWAEARALIGGAA